MGMVFVDLSHKVIKGWIKKCKAALLNYDANLSQNSSSPEVLHVHNI